MPQEEQLEEMPLIIPKLFYMVLLAFGVGFYLIWSAMYDTWTDLAVYTISSICIGLGLIGTILYTVRGREELVAE